VLRGAYQTGVNVVGECVVDAGPAWVHGTLTVEPGSSLIAAYGSNHRTHRGGSSLWVGGSVNVEKRAAVFLGCGPPDFACIDASRKRPRLRSRDTIVGNLSADRALGVLVHGARIGGSVSQIGGGGGRKCAQAGPFQLLPSPVYSSYEDSAVGKSLSIHDLRSCWLGVARVHINGNLSVMRNRLANPDAIEILSNQIRDDLLCRRNSRVWDSAETVPTLTPLYPRTPEPNGVGGRRSGQCELASPRRPGGRRGPGAF
jgi:hypothetical protein